MFLFTGEVRCGPGRILILNLGILCTVIFLMSDIVFYWNKVMSKSQNTPTLILTIMLGWGVPIKYFSWIYLVAFFGYSVYEATLILISVVM